MNPTPPKLAFRRLAAGDSTNRTETNRGIANSPEAAMMISDKKQPQTSPLTGLARLWRALVYSLAGLRAAWRGEAAFRQEVILCLVLVPAAFWLGGSNLEKALLLGSLLLVLLTELLNSAIETVVDRLGEDYHPLSGRAKDLGSAAVFIALINAAVVWLLILTGAEF